MKWRKKRDNKLEIVIQGSRSALRSQSAHAGKELLIMEESTIRSASRSGFSYVQGNRLVSWTFIVSFHYTFNSKKS